jgi:hypothetical protein
MSLNQDERIRKEENLAKLINKMIDDGITLSTRQSDALERDYGMKILPHFLTEFKYQRRHNREIREDFFDFEKEKS